MTKQAKHLIYILNGPNLNLLGKREPHIYGHDTLLDVERQCRETAHSLNVLFNIHCDIIFYQSNKEYELIDWIHEAKDKASGVIINPAAFTHTSIAILDALSACECPIIEVHISNIHQRESFRHHSYVSAVASGVIVGCGVQGYSLAVLRLGQLLMNLSAST